MSKILIVVDMQNDFIYGSLGSPAAESIVFPVLEKVQEARANCDPIIFTKDIHYEDYAETVEGGCVPPHCFANGNGHWIIEELQHYVDYLVVKSTYGYQGWKEYEEFFKDIDYIELCGVCTDICVISNALLLRGIYPKIPIVVDMRCCNGSSTEADLAAVKIMASCNIEVLNKEWVFG